MMLDPVANARTQREKALVAHAISLTQDPSGVTQEEMAPLKEAGLDDRAIVDATLVISYFNFVNRLAEGLGVPLENL